MSPEDENDIRDSFIKIISILDRLITVVNEGHGDTEELREELNTLLYTWDIPIERNS